MASWQSMESLMAMSSVMAARAVPLVAIGSSVVFAISPWQTVQSIARAGSTMQFSFVPFFCFFVQSVSYTLYGYATGNAVMGGTSALGIVLGGHYVYVYCKHAATQRVRLVRWVLTALLLVAMVALFATQQAPAVGQLVIGVPCNILSLLTSSSPLLKLPTIMRTQDASCLPYGMSVMTVVAGCVWLTYGLMLHDNLIVFPNLFALVMGLIQVTLILRFPGAKKGKSSSSGILPSEHAPPPPHTGKSTSLKLDVDSIVNHGNDGKDNPPASSHGPQRTTVAESLGISSPRAKTEHAKE